MTTPPTPTLSREDLASPTRIRRLWHSGANGGPPDWQPQLLSGADGRITFEEPFSKLARAALEFGEAFLSLDIAEAGLRRLERHPESSHPAVRRALNQLGHAKSLALLRTGSTGAALALLQKLWEMDRDDVEIGAALARAYKDLAFSADQSSERLGFLRRSHELYLTTFRRSGSVFPGVNAAATAFWMNQREAAEALAAEVSVRCLSQLQTPPDDYWVIATLAECLLIRREFTPAIEWYAKGRVLVGRSKHWANLNSTRLQARRLCAHLAADFAPLERAFSFPQLVVFSGHMFDRPDRPRPRFPESLEPVIRAEIRQRLATLNAGFGVSSAACGADSIFLEEMLRLGADTRVVLPWPNADFVRSSVDVKPGTDWLERFESLLQQVNSVTHLSQQTEPKATGLGFEYLNECLSGLALMRAAELHAELVPLAVWDRQPGDGPGGTSSFVSFWEDKRRKVEIVSLQPNASAAEPPGASVATERASHAHTDLIVSRGLETIKTMLFADVLGYTKIPAREVEFFATRFLSRISALMDSATQRPILSNTWGDAIYLVFDDVLEAGQFALLLRDLVLTTDWRAEGISSPLNLRISLHTGPVLLCVDPIVRHMTITGAHVSHAARIEPKVRPGEIWASESFAALTAIAALDRPPGFGLDYLGQTELAKSYGTYALFRVRPA